MHVELRRSVAICGLVLFGTALGASCGFLLGNSILSRSARNSLTSYADDLIEQADSYSAELTQIAKAFNPSPYPFCSLQEIRAMQAMAFRSRQVKDIGRTRDGKLYCGGSIGLLPKPLPMPQVSMVSSRGMRVYNDAPIMVSPADRAVLLDFEGVDVVLSPTAFSHWARPNQRYSVVIANPTTGQFVEIAGDKLNLNPTAISAIFAEKEVSASNIVYRSRCSAINAICVVTSEAASKMWSFSEPLVLGYAAFGAFAGLALSAALTLLYIQRLGLAYQLRRAIRRDELQLVYQPIYDLATRRCVSAEALLRWSDADGKEISPDFFVRIAEERGFIRELTAFVIRRATMETRDLMLNYSDFTLSINIAAADLVSESLFSLLEDHVHQCGIASEQIALELTERSTGNLPVVQDAILRLHRHGYKVHIDDFGTGFSSLSYLHQLAVDAIKVDRSFTRTIGTDAVTASILPQILSLAHNLHLGVIVEGVETSAQVSYLESTRKPMQVQGWCFSRPISAAALRDLLEKESVREFAREFDRELAQEPIKANHEPLQRKPWIA